MNEGEKAPGPRLSSVPIRFAFRPRLLFRNSEFIPMSLSPFATIILANLDFPEGPVMVHTRLW